MSFVHDSATAERELVIGAQRKHQAQVDEWAKQEEDSKVIVSSSLEVDLTDAERQIGKSLTSAQFEAKLRPYLPSNVVFIDNPRLASKRAVVFLAPGTMDGFTTICPYEKGLMPEHSIFAEKEEIIRDFSQTHLDRADFPKHEYVPGIGFTYEPGALKPGEKRIQIAWHEVKRGWRTVLLRLIQANLLSAATAERLFGADNRPQWANHTGKQRIEGLKF